MDYMLDTNVFNHVLDGKINIQSLKKLTVFVTHIQRDEIQKTKDEVRRGALMQVFQNVTSSTTPTSSCVAGVSVAGGACPTGNATLPTETAVWGVSKWGEAKWSKGDGLFESMRCDLDGMNKAKKNNTQDILIAETALRNNLILVSSDAALCEMMSKYGGKCVLPSEIELTER
ncbi:hypothetical protein [Duganella callida]|uniref:hypothetical protein n=1 Tax=Duganella callida TaxID=2561932 RepID=UPI00107555A1|nr:hypothetical protein [Duganella callida]